MVKSSPQATPDVHLPPSRLATPRVQQASETPGPDVPKLVHLRATIQPARQALLDHPIYRRIRGLNRLQRFMEQHVFAVWDFMSLLKALQQRICCVQVPWVPNSSSFACRLINEIVLGEESDEDGAGQFASHFELYHAAMRQCGASTVAIDEFLSAIRQGSPVSSALQIANVSQPVRQFVTQTFATIESNDLGALASAFTFGREDLLPGVFRKIVEELNAETHGQLDPFRYYLNRHILVDDDVHGPMAEKLVAHLCGSDPIKWKSAEDAAQRSLQARLELWDRVSEMLG
jgi:hypothetical protein